MKKLRITVDGKAYDVVVETLDDAIGAQAGPAVNSPVRSAVTAPPPSTPSASAGQAAGPGAVVSPLAGRVVSVDCSVGQEVEAGTMLVTLEAMKMNTLIPAPAAGKVTEVLVKAGDAVEEGQTLVVVA